MSSNNIRFSYINVEGYRGRNFSIKFEPKGNTVIVMRGSTGKTTLIELLRWCFNYKESEALDIDGKPRFEHMFARPAHLLDWDYPKEKQKCKIEVHFSIGGHDYKFTRITKGIWDPKKSSEEELCDTIEKIEDSLEIDRGKDIGKGDEVNYMLYKLGIKASADYFLFDGERARTYMVWAGDRAQVENLVDAINKRTVPDCLINLHQQLNELEGKAYEFLNSKATDKGVKRTQSEINKLIADIIKCDQDIDAYRTDKRIKQSKVDELLDENKTLENRIGVITTKNLTEKINLESKSSQIRQKIDEKRAFMFKNILTLISPEDSEDTIIEIKKKIKERGKLPEPYRKDLIYDCLHSKPPTCQICGRPLEKESEIRIKNLEKQIAPHEIQVFLSDENLFSQLNLIDVGLIDKLITEYEENEEKLKKLKISQEQEILLKTKQNNIGVISILNQQIGDLDGSIQAALQHKKDLEDQKAELRTKYEKKKEFKKLFDEIENARNIIDQIEKQIKKEIIEVISNSLSKSISNILGDRFSAKLTENGLLLGENGRYHREVGGMSAKQVLSYCFAECMTYIDPMFIDTPTGNIDDKQRPKLAMHLKANHEQLILLCLPTELQYFAEHLSSKKIEIENKVIKNKKDIPWLQN